MVTRRADGRVECPACHGAGRVEVRAFAGGSSPYDIDWPCQVCSTALFVTPEEADYFLRWRRPMPWQQIPERAWDSSRVEVSA